MDIKGKKVLVFGSGISGEAAAELLLRQGAEVVLYDGNEKLDAADRWRRRLRKHPGCRAHVHGSIVLGAFPEEMLEELASCSDESRRADGSSDCRENERQRAFPIWGEIELAYVFGKGDVLAITGTNGKTTTTALLGRDYEEMYRDSAFVVGNIGNPYTSVVPRDNGQIL